MQTGKIYFIHLRDINQETGEYVQTGGATIAWMVDEEGNLLIGKPARCNTTDNFVKAEGRAVSEHNLMTEAPLEAYTSQEIASIALSGGITALNFSTLTPSARVVLMSKLIELLHLSPAETMSTSWFESFIRSRVTLEKGRPVFDFDGGDASDYAAIQQADSVFAGLMTTTLEAYA